jgi:hypothetical protein
MRKVSWAEMNVTIRYNIRIPTLHKENKPGKSYDKTVVDVFLNATLLSQTIKAKQKRVAQKTHQKGLYKS